MKPAVDTKLRMSIDENIIDRLNEIRNRLIEATRHDKNYKDRTVTIPIPGDAFILFDAFGYDEEGWRIKRYKSKERYRIEYDEDSWEVCHVKGFKPEITTWGKMCVDINREILSVIDEIDVQTSLIEEPIYCPHCQHCGETGCCGFIGFLEKHVRNHTNCMYEKTILDDLEEFIRDHE